MLVLYWRRIPYRTSDTYLVYMYGFTMHAMPPRPTLHSTTPPAKSAELRFHDGQAAGSSSSFWRGNRNVACIHVCPGGAG